MFSIFALTVCRHDFPGLLFLLEVLSVTCVRPFRRRFWKKRRKCAAWPCPSGCSICWARRRGTSPRERSATRAATASSSGASRPVAARERAFGRRR